MSVATKEQTAGNVEEVAGRDFEYAKIGDVAGHLLDIVYIEGRTGNFGPELMLWCKDGAKKLCVTTGATRLVSAFNQGRFTPGQYRLIKSEFPPGWLAQPENEIPF